jgi:alkylation response protein AidB-like acyl-CoA dehydrogenase
MDRIEVMDFTKTDAQEKLIAEVVDFARAELSARAADNDQAESFDRIGWDACAKFGVLGWPVPTEYGGRGLDPVSCVLALEALGYGCTDNGLLFAVNNHLWACTSYLLAHGTAEQRQRWLPLLADGTVVGAHAMTELEAGSDVLSLTTTARRTGDSYVLSGVKTFISNGPVADLFIVFARTDDTAPPQRALSAFLVPADALGLDNSRVFHKSGLRGTPMGEVVFDQVEISASSRLGAEGSGFAVFTSTAEWERGYLIASQVGTMRRLLELANAHARRRRQFGRSIGAFQAVSHRLADLTVRLELAQLLLYKFGWLKQQGRLALLEASMLKLFVSESLVEAALATQRVHGVRGYVAEFGIEREVRDALATTIYAGTSDIHRSIIARLIGVADEH